MEYTNTDAMTGIAVTAKQAPGSTCPVTVQVPAYDGTDDEESLRMQAQAAIQVALALDVMDRALSVDRQREVMSGTSIGVDHAAPDRRSLRSVTSL